MSEIVIYPSRSKTALAFLGSVGFVALGCLLIADSNSRLDDLFMALIGWMSEAVPAVTHRA